MDCLIATASAHASTSVLKSVSGRNGKVGELRGYIEPGVEVRDYFEQAGGAECTEGQGKIARVISD
jgi:hypothetical protein